MVVAPRKATIFVLSAGTNGYMKQATMVWGGNLRTGYHNVIKPFPSPAFHPTQERK
jgi:hypothetical protein